VDKATRLKKLYFRSSHRGSKETDQMLEPFAAVHLPVMDDAELDEFEAFLAEQDTDIWDWVNDKSLPEDGKYKALLQKIQSHYAITATEKTS